jgi:excinuclease Cho
VYARDMDFSAAGGLYGLFRSRGAALERLRELADEWKLCLGVMGVERLQRGRRCFRAGLGRCAGACGGSEPLEAHAARLAGALAGVAIRSWPWPGAVGLVEEDDAMRQVHIVRNWCYLGSVEREADAASLARVAPQFDVDGYRILCRPLLEHAGRLVRFD